MPWERIPAEDLILGRVDKRLKGTIVVASVEGVFLALVGEGPDVAGEGLAEVFGLEYEGILEDLEFVVGDEVVAEGGGGEGEGEEDEDGEVEEAGARGRALRGRRRGDGGRWSDGGWLGDFRRIFGFSGQGVGGDLNLWLCL